ncbi:CDKN2A-interacting protein [Gastrophryne carolinensis]
MAGEEDEVSEYLRQNRDTAAWLEEVRGLCESDKLWRHRREFILRNLDEFCGPGRPPPALHSNNRGLDKLLAYSMVWVNHVFTGCRYPPAVMEKALQMAESIKVTDAPVHTTRDELVAQAKKRGSASSNGYKADETPQALNPSANAGSVDDHCKESKRTDAGGHNAAAAPQPRGGGGECQQKSVKETSRFTVPTAQAYRRPSAEDIKERQSFFNKLYKRVAWKLVSIGGFNPNADYTEILDECIKTLKSTLDVAFLPLKELAELPQNKTSQENIVCEMRCQAVYIGMGCGKTKESAQAVASREAVKLFQKKKVIVKICKRKYSGRDVEDLVLLDEESRFPNLPPAVRNPRDLL